MDGYYFYASMKVTKELIHIAYEVAVNVYQGKLTRKEGIDKIVADGRMNHNSAADYIHNLKRLLEGDKFTRTLNSYAMDYYLQNINLNFGKRGLSNALKALKSHITYYENLQGVTMHLMREIFLKYDKINSDVFNEIEQEEITTILHEEGKTKQQLAQELRNLKPTDPELIVINHKSYKRDNATIAKIKKLRDFKCQICGERIKKKDGSYYIEAAHIEPKHLGGNELPNNIILLCPNHHKEFDYGNHEKLEHTTDMYRFNLNGVEYSISLDLI